MSLVTQGYADARIKSPNIGWCATLGLLTGIAGMWMPLISAWFGLQGTRVLVNPLWGAIYNFGGGLMVALVGDAPGPRGIASAVVGELIWPLLIYATVSYGLFRYFCHEGSAVKYWAPFPFVLSLLINLPGEWFVPQGPACAFFIQLGFLW